MRSTSGRLLAVTAALLVSGAVAASHAVADPPSGGSWTGVTVSDVGACDAAVSGPCAFEANSTAVVFDGMLNCDYTLDGLMSYYGTGDITEMVAVPGNNYWCNTYLMTDSEPWPGQICAHVPEDGPVTYWLQLHWDQFSPSLGTLAGIVYAELTGGGTTLSVNGPIHGTSHTFQADGAGGSAPYNLDAAISAAAGDPVENPCAWTEYPE